MYGLLFKLVCCSLVVLGASGTDYGLSDLYAIPYAPHYHNYKPKDYKFEYGVSDPSTGDHKSQWEVKENGVVRGAYSLLEPDGSTRIVEYIADDGGFRAVVKKIGASLHTQAPVVVQPAPLSHVSYLYDQSSGAYGGQKENYIAAYQPRPVVYQDNSVHHGALGLENVHGHADDDVQIFFNDHNAALLNKGAIVPQYLDQQEVRFVAPKEHQLVGIQHQPEVNYVLPKEVHIPHSHPEVNQYIASKQQLLDVPQYLGVKEQQFLPAPVASEGYFEPHGDIVGRLGFQHQHQQQQQQQHILQAQPVRHNIVQQHPELLQQHQIAQHQYVQPELVQQHQFVQPELLQHNQQILQHQPVQRVQVVHQQQPHEHQEVQYQQQPEVGYYEDRVQGHARGGNLQLAPVAYKGQNAGYDYGY